MRHALLRFLLVAVPLVVVPWAVTFDASKALLLAMGALVLAAASLPRKTEGAPGRFDLRWSRATVAMAVALGAFLLTAPVGPDPWAAARVAALLLPAAVLALAFENVVVEDGELEPLLAATALGAGLVSAYGLLQRAGVDLPLPWRETHPGLPVSTLGNPNFAAEYVAAAVPAGVLVAIRSAGARRGAAVLGLLLGVGLLVAARGRAAVAGLVLGGGVAVGLGLAVGAAGGRRMAGLAAAALLAAAGLAGAAGVYGGDGPAEWLGAAGRTDTVLVRRDLARGTLAMAAAHPLGVGAGNWAAAHPPHRTEAEYRASLYRDPGEAHCEPLQWAAEGGWGAAALAAAWAALLAAAAARALRAGRDRGLVLALGATGAVLLVQSCLSPVLHRPPMLLLGALATGGLSFLGGGTVTTLGTPGGILHRALVGALLAAVALQASLTAGEGPLADARARLRAASPLPAAEARVALGRLEHALGRDPGSIAARSLAGEVALRLADLEPDPAAARALRVRARDHFAALRRLRPLDPVTTSNLALATAALDEGAAAEALWREALAVQPFHREGNHALGFHLVRTGRPAEGLLHLEAALAVDPLYAPSAGTRVEALQALGREGDALAAASDAVDRFLAATPRRLEEAAETARRAAAAAPLQARMLTGKARRLLGAGDREGALALLPAVAAAARDDEEVLGALADAWEESGHLPEALRCRVDARFASAERFLAGGEGERAASQARLALEIPQAAEGQVRTRVRAASVLARAGHREEAIGHLAVAMARGYPDPDGVQRDPAFAALRDDPGFRAALARSPLRRKE